MFKSNKGQSLVEYSLILLIVSVIVLAVMQLVGPGHWQRSQNLGDLITTSNTIANSANFHFRETLTVEFELTNATKQVNGAYAYWETKSDGRSCFFGIHTPFGWSASILKGPCPENPDDDTTISELIQRLWDSFPTGSWSGFLSRGGRVTEHIKLMIEVAKLYGIQLIP